MAGSHGGVRGLSNVSRSSISGARFGRMFRSLPRETYDRADLTRLAKCMIQAETALIVGANGQLPSGVVMPASHVAPTEGPDVVQPFPQQPPHEHELLDTVYGVSEPDDENPVMPAGYTYVGQFIDHDLTFDPNSSLQKLNDPDGLEDFRTPRLDLDSLYGRGPDDQPYLYQDAPDHGGGIRFRVGVTKDGTDRPGELQRNADDRALTGDPRNDENAIICQLQAVFLNFHNRVVDTLEAARPLLKKDHHACFLEAQRIVRWHYQYIVLNDYLKRIVGKKTWRHVFQGSGEGHPEPHLKFYHPKQDQAYMPVEFSVAAFRFGHSMVRPSYALRADDRRVGGGDADHPFSKSFHRIPLFSEDGTNPASNLHGFSALPEAWEIDWRLFFAKGALLTTLDSDKKRGVTPQTGDHLTQPGYRIDTKLVDPLAMLPVTVAKSGNQPDGIPVLAYRNLLRGSQFELPSGQSVARALELPVLSEEELWSDINDPVLKDTKTNPFAYRAPLWYYILKEAERTKDDDPSSHTFDTLGGHRLGDVGGRIVAEVLVGIAVHDHSSYLCQDIDWTPASEKARSGFDPGEPITDMYQLIHWTTRGTMTFLP